MDEPRWGVAVSTRNRADALRALVESLCRQTTPPNVVAIVDQSDNQDLHSVGAIEKTLSLAGIKAFVRFGSGGASRGRNDAVELLLHLVDWVATPNDTSSLPTNFGTLLLESIQEYPSSSCLVASYRDGPTPTRILPERGTRIYGWNMWLPIEPACIWNLAAFTSAGGFDTEIGVGSGSRAQSGEGTDLLCKVAAIGPVVCIPHLLVKGRPHGHQLTTRQRVSKDHSYAIGTGVVYRRHFSGFGAWVRLLWPAVDGLVAAITKGRISEIYAGAARAHGRLYGYLLPGHATRHVLSPNTSDTWRTSK